MMQFYGWFSRLQRNKNGFDFKDKRASSQSVSPRRFTQETRLLIYETIPV